MIYLNKHHRKIKDFFIDQKIPRFDRGSIPLLADGNDIIAIIGIVGSDYYNKIDGSRLYLQIWKGLE
jgi:tRNA(Ile)-lysidine synthase